MSSPSLDAPWVIAVPRLARIANPFKQPIWTEKKLTKRHVDIALQHGRIAYDPVDSVLAADHAARIAYFVTLCTKAGSAIAALEPIEVDVGCPSFPGYDPVRWIVTDGNHRLAACIYRQDPIIQATVSGELRYARLLLQNQPRCGQHRRKTHEPVV